MAQRHGHRRRRGRFSALVKLLCAALILTAAVMALTLFFKVQHITVVGAQRYEASEVIAASGIEVEDNLFLLNKYSVAQAIFDTLPYVEEASLRRALPDTIVITVHECVAESAVETAEGYWLVSGSGKLLERVGDAPESCPTVRGLTLTEAAPSLQLAAVAEETAAVEALLEILRAATERGLLADISRVDLSDPECIRMSYLGRFSVKLPWDSDMATVLRGMEEVATGELETNQTGEISFMNLADKGVVNFIPGEVED